ncbi:MAG: divalent-cation tolerance protein CutA [bacterium]
MEIGSEFQLVLSTVPNLEKGKEIGQSIVSSGLAACVNLVPGILSIYIWEGKQCEDDEVLLVIKTTGDKIPALIGKIVENHPYKVPEIIALPIIGGNENYLKWVRESTMKKTGEEMP